MLRIEDFDVAADGCIKVTHKVQALIDACAKSGGGEIRFSPGRYLCGTLRLRSNVTLYLEAGATLLASPDIADYPEDVHHQRYLNEPQLDRCFLYAEDEKNITIAGDGTIDGNGANFPNSGDPNAYRPMLIRMLNCSDISLRDVRLINPGAWTTAFLHCVRVKARGLTIISRPFNHGNGDGLDFDACRDVIVSDCSFDTSDDCLCLQNSFEDVVSENITVTNCVMTSTWAGIRIGLMNRGAFRYVTVSNLVMHDIACSGLKIQATEGGLLSNMRFENILMRNVPRSVFMTLNHFRMGVHSPEVIPFEGGIQGLRFRGIMHENARELPYDTNEGIVVLGVPGARIRDISFEDMDMLLRGGGHTGGSLPELTGKRPEFFVFDKQLPASAVTLRHVENVALHGVCARFHAPDMRPGIVIEDAEGVKKDGCTL